MKLHYAGKYNLNPESRPHGEHRPGAVPFKELQNPRDFAVFINAGCLAVTALLMALAFWRSGGFYRAPLQFFLGVVTALFSLLPHELLHGLCFRGGVYLYTSLRQGMLFVVGPEEMSKARFVFMSLLPNLVFGFFPFLAGMLFPRLLYFLVLGALTIGMGFGDYYNVHNALTQMPKGARTYLSGFHSFWYLPE